MKNKKLTTLLVIGLITGLVFIYFPGCKKIDLKRIAYVKTEPAEDVSPASVKATGDIIDLGEGGKIKEYGFCLSYSHLPTIADKAIPPFENTSKVGKYYSNISSLISNRPYQMRSYVVDQSDQVVYGNVVEFHTPAGGGGDPTWLHYDDGFNNDNGVGLSNGGSFDVAIRFPTQVLQQYNGFRVTKVKFFPMEGTPVSYGITFWEGTNPPNLIHDVQYVPNPNIQVWNEVSLTQEYIINSNTEFWVGYWVQDQPSGKYPAGVDAGPAISGAGDMISFDDGDSWDALSVLNPDMDYNWNLQVFVTNEKGVEIQLVNNIPMKKEKGVSSRGKNINKEVSAKKQSNN